MKSEKKADEKTSEEIREAVKKAYAEQARNSTSNCCGSNNTQKGSGTK